MSDLPSGWEWVDAGSVTQVQGGIQKQPKRRPAVNRFPFLRVANVLRGRLDLGEVHEIELFDGEIERYRLQPGDLLVVEGNGSPDQIGRAAQWHGEIADCVHQNHLIRVRPTSAIIPEYLTYYWNAPRTTEYLRSVASSTSGLYVLTASKVRSVQIPLPPIDEQARIVAAIEEQFSRLDAGTASLESAKRRISSIRASILQSAISGALTGDSGALENTGLPAGWKLCSVDEISANTRNSLAIGPFGSNLKVSDYVTQGVPLIFVRNVRSAVFGGAGTRFVSKEKADELRAHRAQAGDVLITKMGDPPGDANVYPSGYPDAIITADVIKLSVRDGVAPEYIALAIHSKYVRDQFIAITRGVAQQKVSLARLRQSIRIPVPPNEEQLQIVRAVSWRMQEVDRMESAIEAQLHRSSSLRVSILKEAFTGKLASA